MWWMLVLFGCGPKTDRITPAVLHAAMQRHPDDYLIVDVRTGLEFRSAGGHIEGAINIAYPATLWSADQVTPSDGQTVVLVCLTGHRSRFPLHTMRTHHPTATVVDLDGGMRAWWAAELPTVTGVR